MEQYGPWWNNEGIYICNERVDCDFLKCLNGIYLLSWTVIQSLFFKRFVLLTVALIKVYTFFYQC